MPRQKTVFAHGSGRSGTACWPNQVGGIPDAVFVTFPGYGIDSPRPTEIGSWVDSLLRVSPQPIHIVASSYGGIPAILAAGRYPTRIQSLVLLEPAAYSLARGDAGVEAFIARMNPVMAAAGEADGATFVVAFLAALTGEAPVPPASEADLVDAERLRMLAPPWSFDLPRDAIAHVPTLVVTGNWNPEYESIAASIVASGGTHLQLEGCGHRVQDHPAINAVITDWTSTHEPTLEQPRSSR